MAEANLQLRDPGAERSLLSTIIQNGKDAFIDADSVVDSTDFSLGINRTIYTAIKNLAEDPNCNSFDIESIKLKSKALGREIDNNKELQYLNALEISNFATENIPMFALQVKKYSVVRDLYKRYTDATKYLENITGSENLSDIIRKAEGQIIDFVTGVEGTNALEQLTDDLIEYIEQAIEEEIIDQVGLPSGFPIWDDAIGGGPRIGTVSMIGSRAKKGKSWLAMNMARNFIKRKIPTLLLDTELEKVYQRDRLICIDSQCPIKLFETRKFKHFKEHIDNLRESARELENLPFHYESISGMSHTEALAIARRWLVKHVGFNEDGSAKDCVIIYDYMKLMDGSSLTKVTPEYIVLGLMLTDLHNFALKYKIPIIGFVQLNREGIDTEETNVIAGSDRILWLCSSLTLLKDKSDAEKELCPYTFGNKKLSILETRHGAGLEVDGDYVNLHASISPGVPKEKACGLITEGLRYSQVCNVPTAIQS